MNTASLLRLSIVNKGEIVKFRGQSAIGGVEGFPLLFDFYILFALIRVIRGQIL
jgi:hypothetical protein